MKKGIKNKINLINDVSGLEYDPSTIQVLRDTNIPFVITSYARRTKDYAKESFI